jgi:hypothetical protein
MWQALLDELARGFVQSVIGLLIVALNLLVYFIFRYTKPNIRFHKIKDPRNSKVTFLIRNFDSVRYREKLVVRLESLSTIEHVSVHGGPYCEGPPIESEGADKGNILITFNKVPADATFSIRVKVKQGKKAKIWLAKSSRLRPRNFDRKLEPLRGVRRVGYFLVRGLAGLAGFVAVLLIGLALDGDVPSWADWAFIGAAIPLAAVVFVLVVPTGGKPIVAGYLGWSGASKDWQAGG